MTVPHGYSDQDKPGCPECGAELDATFVDVSSLGQLRREHVLSTFSCPSSPLHDVEPAYEAMRLVEVAHPDRDDMGSCTLFRLNHWRRRGWYPTDPDLQTPTEMVHVRVRELARDRMFGRNA